MLLVGIDYSYTSPGIAILPYSNTFRIDCVDVCGLIRGGNKLKTSTSIVDLKDFDDKPLISKFCYLANYIKSMIIYRGHSDIKVAMEDYSFGSHSGRNFTIGENAGILKAELFKKGIPLRLYSPTLVKRFVKERNEEVAIKFSEGKLKKDGSPKIGSLKKEAMHEIMCYHFNMRVEDYFQLKPYKSPLSDIVDAIWILYILWLEEKVSQNDFEFISESEIEFIKKGVDGTPLYKKPYIF